MNAEHHPKRARKLYEESISRALAAGISYLAINDETTMGFVLHELICIYILIGLIWIYFYSDRICQLDDENSK